ncbi:protein of unknown function [Pseudodesulfovibrio piezophilus C1TLV30]|uniref:Cadherin domain-containing protein n=1 Tax=Pseudodesulfovibrio piezophilus (strain DSM 21447 / JCM 15486 / C1TLV30) TaxID=1322246 RepID=M1WU03_PSEP2|nr:protein of unknown function [Pseudodesulfovibrio piezophilus C1TLV30]
MDTGDSAVGSVTELGANVDQDVSLTTSGTLSISDADSGQALFDTNVDDSDNLGHLTITEDGQWTYTIDNTLSEVQQLGTGDSFTETFTVTSADGTDSQTITVTVNGTNDAPQITDVVSYANDFEHGATGWSNNTVTETDGVFTDFLGRFGTGDSTVKTFDVVDGADSVTIDFDMYEIDSWTQTDNAWGHDDLIITVDGNDITIPLERSNMDYSDEDNAVVRTGTVETESGTITWTFTATEPGTTNKGFGSYEDQIHHVTLTIENPGDSVTLGLGSTLNEALNNESFGIDNIVVNASDDAGNPVFSVLENITDDTTVAQLISTDVEGHDVVYQIVSVIDADGNDVSGMFTIDGDKVVAVGDSGFDYETNASYTVTVVPTDTPAEGALSGDPVSFTVRIGDVNEAPDLDFSSLDTSTNYIVNGSFEDVAIDSGDWAQGHTPEGWTLVEGDRWEVMSGDRFGIDGASDGNNVIDFGVGTHEALVISQEVTGLSEGDYVLTLDMFDRSSNLGGDDGGAINVYWNGELVGTFNPGDTEWETGTINITVGADETSGTLVLESSDNDGYGNVVDNISLYAVSDDAGSGVTITENSAAGTYVATALGTDVDTPDEDLRFSIADGTPFVIDAVTGVITLAEGATLDYENQDSYSVDITVTDGDLSTTKTLTINVGDVNEAPTATDIDLGHMSEDGIGGDGSITFSADQLLAGASDVDGDSLSIDNLSLADGHGTLTDNHDGTWTFTPDANWNGDVEFNYSVTDGTLSTEQTASLTVDAVDDPTVIDFATGVSGHNLVINGSFEDVTIDSGDWAQGHTPEGWTLVEGDRWEAMSGDRFGIIGASDGDNVIDTGVGGNEALVISQEISGLSEGQYILELDLFDRGSNLGEADSGNIEVYWNGELVATYNPDDVNWETGTVVITVGEGETSGELVLASYNNDNYANVIDNISLHSVDSIESGPVEINEGVANGTYIATAFASDVDSTDLSFSITDPDSPFSIDSETGIITVSDSADLDGNNNYDIVVTVTDGDGHTVNDVLNVVVNEPPTSTDFTVSGDTMHAPIAIDFTEDVNIQDIDGTVTDVIITSLPDADSGTLYFNGEPVVEGNTYSLSEGSFSFQAEETDHSTILLGSKEGNDPGLTNWGADSDDVRTTTLSQEVDGHTVTVTSGTGELVQDGDGNYSIVNAGIGDALQQYDENDPSHIGSGIADNDGNGIESGETISVSLGGVVSTAQVGLDGLGSHFEAESGEQAKAVWIATLDGEVVGSGVVENAVDNDTLFEQLTITTDMIDGGLFDTITFTTDSSSGSNWELRYVEAEYGLDTSFTYVPVDNDGLAGNESSVSIEITPDVLTTNEPTSDSFATHVDHGQSVAIDFGGHVLDVEDGSVNTVVIKSLPTDGSLVDDHGNAIVVGQEYNVNDINYVASDSTDGPDATGVFLGTRHEGDQSIDNWGTEVDANTRVLHVSDTISVTVSSNDGALTQYNAENPNHMGVGIGDNDGNGINSGEVITVAFDGAQVSTAEVTFDGLGSDFAEGGSVGATATWVAYNGDTIVAQGEVYAPESGLESVVTIGQDILNGQLFDRIEFSTDSDSSSNWELRSVDAEFGSGDSFEYYPVDSDGLTGNASTVTLTYDAPDTITHEAPVLDLGDGSQVVYDGEHAGYTNMLGIYFVEDGTPSNPEIILTDSKDVSILNNVIATFEGDQDVHFFLVSDAGGEFSADQLGSEMHFVMDNGNWALAMGNDTVDVQFDIAQFNPNGEEASFRFETNADGSLSVEVDDQLGTWDDDDFDDISATVNLVDDGTSDYATTWVENHEGVSIAGDVAISDEDSSRMSSATIILTNAHDGDILNTDALPDGITAQVVDNGDTITVTLSGTMPISDYQEAIHSITYENHASSDPDVTDRVVEVTLFDESGTSSNVATTTISVVDVDVSSQIVLNPSFESSDRIYGSWTQTDGVDNWSNPSDGDIEIWNNHMGKNAADGNQFIELDSANDVDSLSQIIATKAGEMVNLSFAFAPRPGTAGETNDFDVSLGGVLVATVAWNAVDHVFEVTQPGSTEVTTFDYDGSDSGWNTISLDVQAPTDHAELLFTEHGDHNDTFGILLDDVQVHREFDSEILGTHHADTLLGTPGDDFIMAVDNTSDSGHHNHYGSHMTGDYIDGGAGHDAIYGGDGNDILIGGEGNDFIYGGGGNDTIDAGSGNDFINAGSGHNVVTTGDGNDTLFIDQSALNQSHSEIVVNDFVVGTDALEMGDGMSVKDITTVTENSIQYTQVLVGDDHDNNVIVKLLGVTQTDLDSHSTGVDAATHSDDLIQYMIDSGHNS